MNCFIPFGHQNISFVCCSILANAFLVCGILKVQNSFAGRCLYFQLVGRSRIHSSPRSSGFTASGTAHSTGRSDKTVSHWLIELAILFQSHLLVSWKQGCYQPTTVWRPRVFRCTQMAREWAVSQALSCGKKSTNWNVSNKWTDMPSPQGTWDLLFPALQSMHR